MNDPGPEDPSREALVAGETARIENSRNNVARRISALRAARELRRDIAMAAPRPPEPAAAAPGAPVPLPASIELSATGVRRLGSGWRASCRYPRGVDARYVSDANNGGYVGAFLHALEVRDRFYREHSLPIPPAASVVLDEQVVTTEVKRVGSQYVVRWQGEEYAVEGDDAEEIATRMALDLFGELVRLFPLLRPLSASLAPARQGLPQSRLAELAKIGKAVGDPSRLGLLELLALGQASVEALAQAAGISPSNASRHLRILREAGLVEAAKRGIHVFHRLADQEVSALTRSLRILAERRSEESGRFGPPQRRART